MTSKDLEEGSLVECSFRSIFYPAKIIKIDLEKPAAPYLIHYQGWKKRWDEWVPSTRFKGSSSSTGSSTVKSKSSKQKVASPSLVSEKESFPVKKQPLPERTKHRGRPRKTEEINKNTSSLKVEPVSRAKSASIGSRKSSSKSSPARIKEDLIENDDEKYPVQEANEPVFERILENNCVSYKNHADGKSFKSISELKKYFKQKRMEFNETEFDFTVPLEPKEEPMAKKSTKKSKTVKKAKKNKQELSNLRKNLKESELSNEQEFDPLEIPMSNKSKKISETSSEQQQISPLEILDDIKQMQDVYFDTSKKLETPLKKEIPTKRGRGRPSKTSTQTASSKIAKRIEDSSQKQVKEPMEMEIAADVSDSDSKTNANKDDEFSLMMESSSTAGMTEMSTSPTFINPNGRPMRSRKPNQRFNVLISEMESLERQGRRRRYSSKHSTTSGDEMLSDSNTAEEEHPLVIKIGSPKKKRDQDLSLTLSPKRKKQGYTKKSKGESKIMNATSSDFESAPEFVEIQSRGHSPQEHDDGLPPVLGMSDGRNIRSRSLDPLPLVDQMCDALATTPSNETPPSMDHLISEFSASQERMQQHLEAAESLAAPGLSPNSTNAELQQGKKRVRKSGSKKPGKTTLIADDGSPAEPFSTSTIGETQPKQRRKKEKKFSYSSDDQPPAITSEEIEEGLQTLKALEAQSMQGIKVSTVQSQPGINITARSPQVVLKVKPTESRGRGRAARRSTTSEIPLLHRESEPSNDHGNVGLTSMGSPPQQIQQRQQHQTTTGDESTRFCYLPPEIMGDHCYGKSFPNANFGVGGSSVETPDTSVYVAEPSDVIAPPLHRAARGRPPRFELLQRSPSPPPYKSSEFLGDSVGSYAYHRLETDYGGNSGVGSTNVVLPASIMSGGQVPMLSDKLPANILEDDGDMNDDEEITAVDIS